MENFFEHLNEYKKPLAERMRPTTLQDFVGQQHILQKGKMLYRLIESKRVPSIILYGSPGTGKTTLAQIIANTSDSNFIKFNAVHDGVSDVKDAIKTAKQQFDLYGKKTYLLLDECHRWSKAQSDSLLGVLEQGYLYLIGSTTENPQYSMTRAIVSRCSLFEFKRLSKDDIKNALMRAIKSIVGLESYNIVIENDAIDYFCTACGGDLRAALNALEIAALTTEKNAQGITPITKDIAVECLQKKALSLDDDLFYHILSAFCKSLRGSDATAALYYANRLLQAGVEPQLIARRTIAHASEDVGLACPDALTQACNALYAIDKLGMPEGNLALTQAILFVSNAKKSNSVVIARDLAISDAINNVDDKIPEYLKNHTEASKFYKYPHDYPNSIVEQQYLPDSLKNRKYIN